MEFHLSAFVVLLVVWHAAALSSEVYWHSVLPNTPIPKSIQDLLPENEKPSSASFKDNAGSVGVGGGGVSVDIGRKGGGGGSGGVSVDTGHKGGPQVRVQPPYIRRGSSPSFSYEYAASEDQLKDNPNVALFFLEKDLHPGTKMNLHFTKTMVPGTKFLPRHVAESLPFSSNKFSEILNRFSVKPESEEAQVMKTTINECEKPAIGGEGKYCATSLEAIVDFTTSKLGKDVQAMSTEVDHKESQKQEFSVSPRVKKMAGDKIVACHGQDYVYPVFYCHATHNTRAYLVPLMGVKGTKAMVVAVCHMNTSSWNPKHLAFQVLGVKPGTVPICHFLPEDHIIWVSN